MRNTKVEEKMEKVVEKYSKLKKQLKKYVDQDVLKENYELKKDNISENIQQDEKTINFKRINKLWSYIL